MEKELKQLGLYWTWLSWKRLAHEKPLKHRKQSVGLVKVGAMRYSGCYHFSQNWKVSRSIRISDSN